MTRKVNDKPVAPAIRRTTISDEVAGRTFDDSEDVLRHNIATHLTAIAEMRPLTPKSVIAVVVRWKYTGFPPAPLMRADARFILVVSWWLYQSQTEAVALLKAAGIGWMRPVKP